jgi:peptidoglycan/LPS O-acetylase OafA/YrhL
MISKSALVLSVCFLLAGVCLSQDAPTGTPCQEALKKISWELGLFVNDPNPLLLSNYSQNFLAFSGRFINDFGEYEVCQNATASHYLTMNFSAALSPTTAVTVVIGFCAPSMCSAEESKELIDLVFKIYQQGMGLPLAKLTKPADTYFYDPRSSPPGGKAATVIIFVILSLIVGLSFAGTGFGVYSEYRAKQRFKKTDESETLLLNGQGNARAQNESSSERTEQSIADEVPKRELRGVFKFLDCFDARKNFEKIIKIKYTATYDQNLEIFNGIRVLMMLYVVYGHSFLFGTTYVDNLTDLSDLIKDWWLLVLYAALYSVDVFFYMSGFLFAYIGTGKLKKVKATPLNYIGLCIHRLLRFWPTYAVALIFFWRVLPYLGEGPVWFQMTYYTSLCEGTIWQNFALLDDMLVSNADYCFGWGWYLSNDFQMFLITPFFLWLYIRKRRVGKLAIFALICGSWVLSLIIGADLDVRANLPTGGGIQNQKAFANYYIKPWIRLPPYFIGILAALIYKEFREEVGWSYKIGRAIQRSAIAKNLISLLGLAIMLALVFVLRQLQVTPDSWPIWVQVTWRAFQKGFYVIAMTMFILPILLGDNNIVKKFLAHPIFVPLARLSFTAYLVHLFWVYKNYYDLPFSFHITYTNGTLNTISNAAISFGTGLILSLVMEVPMANIESNYLSGGGGKGKGSRPKKPVAEDTTQINISENSVMPVVSDKKE